MKKILLIILSTLLFSCNNTDDELANTILANKDFSIVKDKALSIMLKGFSAGDGYGEVWIRDFNTFMELAIDVQNNDTVKNKLLTFFKFQGDDGNIVDGYISKKNITEGAYNYYYTSLSPNLAAHKNNVETDQESSLIQGVYKYVSKTGDTDFLKIKIEGISVSKRMELALDYLYKNKYDDNYGLIYGGTTIDWGDVQPEDYYGVVINENTHYSIDIYDNAMLVIAIKNFVELVPSSAQKWRVYLGKLQTNIRKTLWDDRNMKFHPHIYLVDSPFPKEFDEDKIFYTGGTAVAIEAGLLTEQEINISLQKMLENQKIAGAATFGISVFPAYPKGYFKHQILSTPFTYQNGGDWTWFGARMIQQLTINGFVKEANEQIQPFLKRVIINNGFYEWYTLDNKPRGSATYRGSAGVLYKAILLLEKWAQKKD